MRNILILLTASLLTMSAQAQHDNHPAQHPPHNMVILGHADTEDELYISHQVYKSPHNYQVEMKVKFQHELAQRLHGWRARNPTKTFMYRLDGLHIGDIGKASEISGDIIAEDETGNRSTYQEKVTVPKENYKILYFYELPLNL